MGIYTLIPVQKAFHINGLADFQILHCGINLSGAVTEIRLDGEGVDLALLRIIKKKIIAFCAGAVPVV